ELLQRTSRRLRQRWSERRKQPRPGLNENDPRAARVDGAEVGCECSLRQFRDGAGHLHAGRAAADHDEVQQTAALLDIRFAFGAFKREQDPAAQIRGVIDGLQAWRVRRPIVAEISVLGPGGNDEVVERNATALRDHFFVHRVYTRNFGEDDVSILLTTEDAANR